MKLKKVSGSKLKWWGGMLEMDALILLCLETALGRRSIALMRWQLIISLELPLFFCSVFFFYLFSSSACLLSEMCAGCIWGEFCVLICIQCTSLKTLHCAFPWFTFGLMNSQSLPNDYLADWEFFVLSLLPNTLNPPEGRCRHRVSPLSSFHTHTHTHTHTHRRLHRNINWIPGLFTQCLSAGYRQGSPVYRWVGFMVSLSVSNKHLSICAAGSQQQEPCFRSGR